jgi:hypothetical protein
LICLLFFPLTGCSKAPEEVVAAMALDSQSLKWIGTRVFHNECAGRESCLVHWNEGEAFPSLGIGHFIWYPTGVDDRFVESFPAMIDYLRARGVKLPDLLARLEPFDAPWNNRDAFLRNSDTASVRELRSFLSGTRGEQAGFLVQRAQRAFGRVLAAAPEVDRESLADRIRSLINTPGGAYAVIDYVNFKGEGVMPSERYHGDGWGLLQVLQGMDKSEGGRALDRFRESSMRVLTQRAEHAARAIEKERWLAGWLNRLETYREPE